LKTMELKQTESALLMHESQQTTSAQNTLQAEMTEGALSTLEKEKTAFAAAWTDTPTVTPSATPDPLIPPDCTQIGQKWISPVDGMTLVCVPAGEFIMGNDLTTAWQLDESPAHQVYLDDYWIDRNEVTNQQFANYLNTNFPVNLDLRIDQGNIVQGSEILYKFLVQSENWMDQISFENGTFKPLGGAEDLPVAFVTWYGAQAYCEWAGRALPTEAQWEKAARGMDERQYPWGNEWDSNKTNSVMNDPFPQTSPIGSFPNGISPYGAFDMSGNLWEWVADFYDPNFYQYSPLRNPTGPIASYEKVLRGGSWEDSVPFTLRITDRYNRPAGSSLQDYGFRCVYFGQ